MSVYTTVEPARLDHFLRRYDLGRARSLQPIAAGITNTNYYLDTDAGSYVLTLYEHHGDDELAYMLGLQQHLAARGVRCAAPVSDRRGEYFSHLSQRPAAIIERLPGVVVDAPEERHCARVGAELARFHLAGADFERRRDNPRGSEWLLAMSDLLSGSLSQQQRELFENTLDDLQSCDAEALPRGAVHADLFHDNALFVDNELSGIVDFDYACHDSLVFDIAVMINDWCIDSVGELRPPLVDAVLGAYQRHRRLEGEEIAALPLMLRLGALRFWISRLYDKLFPLAGELTFIKNPDRFRDMLVARGRAAAELEALFLPHQVR